MLYIHLQNRQNKMVLNLQHPERRRRWDNLKNVMMERYLKKNKLKDWKAYNSDLINGPYFCKTVCFVREHNTWIMVCQEFWLFLWILTRFYFIHIWFNLDPFYTRKTWRDDLKNAMTDRNTIEKIKNCKSGIR